MFHRCLLLLLADVAPAVFPGAVGADTPYVNVSAP